MGSPSTQNEVVYQTVEVKAEIGGKTFGTTAKYSEQMISEGHFEPKELALKTLKSLVETMENEIAAGNLN